MMKETIFDLSVRESNSLDSSSIEVLPGSRTGHFSRALNITKYSPNQKSRGSQHIFVWFHHFIKKRVNKPVPSLIKLGIFKT